MSPDRMRTGSVRRRVTLAVLALLLVVIVALCLAVNVFLENRLRDDARAQLQDRAGYATVLARKGLSAQELADGLTGQGITATVLRNGQVVVGRDQGPRAGPGGPGRPGPPPARPAVPTVPVSIATEGRGLSTELDLGTAGKLRLFESTAEIDRTLGLLHRIEAVAALIVLGVGALALFVVVGAALRPLRRISGLADRIRDGERGGRLRPTRPTTDVGRTALALDEMLDELEGAEARMRRLLADVSHDLRTPLAGVISSAEQVLRDDPPRAEREQRLVALVRESRRAARLVDDLLLMARLDERDDSGRPGTRPVDLGALAGSAVERLRERCPDRTVDLVAEPAAGVLVEADPDMLDRVLTNLLDNARDATEPGGRIVVVVSTEPAPQGARAVVDVRDDGPGIPDADRERVFDRFTRLDPSRRAGGSGLGLPIARTVARRHGGDVVVVPSPRGAHLRLALPLGSGAAEPAIGRFGMARQPA